MSLSLLIAGLVAAASGDCNEAENSGAEPLPGTSALALAAANKPAAAIAAAPPRTVQPHCWRQRFRATWGDVNTIASLVLLRVGNGHCHPRVPEASHTT